MAKKIILGVLAGVLGLILLAAVGALVFLNWPSLLLGEATLTKLAAYGPRFGFHIEFSEATSSSRSHGFINEEPTLHFKDLCISAEGLLEKLCFKQADLSLHYDFKGFQPVLISLGPVKLTEGELKYTVQAKSEEELKKQEEKPVTARLNLPAVRIPDMLKGTVFYPVSMDLKRLEITKGESFYTGDLSVEGKVTQDRELESVSVKGHFTDETKKKTYPFEAVMDSPTHFRSDDWHLFLATNAELEGGKSVGVKAHFTKTGPKSLKHKINADLGLGKMSAVTSFEGELSEKEFTAVMDATVRNLHRDITEASVSGCLLKNTATDLEKNDGELNLDCPVTFQLRPYNFHTAQKGVGYATPAKGVLDVLVNAHTFFYPDMDKPVDGRIRLALRPYKSGLVATKGGADVELRGIPSKFPEDMTLITRLNADFEIERFSRLVKILETSAFSVPAPFHVMDGPVKLSVKGEVPEWRGVREFPLEFTTRLTSAKQKFDLDVKGQATVNFDTEKMKPSADLEVNLTDIKLELPTFTPPDIPQLLPDSRIKRDEPKKPKGAGFDYHVKIKTPKPVQMISNLAKTPIPLTIDLDVTPKGRTGRIELGDFLINLFRRDARIQHLRLELKDPMGNSPVDGSVRFASTDYLIFILLQGSVEQPHVIFDSDPPLPQEDILSAIVFGEPQEELDTDQADTVGQMSAAFADKALALSSLFLLASTPIERVNYNPQTRVFEAKFRLGKGTSLTFGKGEENYKVGVRRKLGKGWIINTSLDSPEEDDADSSTGGSAFIEWHKRY